MNDIPWRRYVSLFTTTPIDVDSDELASSLEDAFRKNGIAGPYNTEKNLPNNDKGAPVVKVETTDGKSGVWIGNHLIFMPVGSEEDLGCLLTTVAATKLSQLGAHSYSLNSTRLTTIAAEYARESTNPDIIELLQKDKPQEFSKDVSKELTDTLSAKDVIKISRSKDGGLTVDMTIVIDSTDSPSGRTIGEILQEIDFKVLKAHENEVKQQADSIIIGR